MKKLILAASLLAVSISATAGNMIKAGEVQGAEYNKVWKKSFKRDLKVWVTSDQLQVTSDAALGATFVDFDADVQGRAAEFAKHIAKAIKWSKIAKENNADVVKIIGEVVDNGKVRFGFISNGSVQMLAIDIEDFESNFKKNRILLTSVQQMQDLKAIFDNIDQTLTEAAEMKANEDLFQ